MKKRIMATLLSLCLVVGLLPVTAMAAGPEPNSVETEAQLLAAIDGATGTAGNPTVILIKNNMELTKSLLIGSADRQTSKYIKLVGSENGIQLSLSDNFSATYSSVICVFSGLLELENIQIDAEKKCRVVFVEGNDNATLTINQNSVLKNGKTTGNSAGAAIMSYGKTIMNGGTISDCAADAYGGAICVDNATYGSFTMNNGTIINCTAGIYAGAIMMRNGKAELKNGTIKNNRANGTGNSSRSGGAIWAQNSSTVSISGDVVFSENYMENQSTKDEPNDKIERNDITLGKENVCYQLTSPLKSELYLNGAKDAFLTGTNTYSLNEKNLQDYCVLSGKFVLLLNSEENKAKIVPANIITFHANDGSATPATVTQTVPSGIGTALTANTFTRTGYNFAGWKVDGADTTYADEAKVTLTADPTLLAQWTPKQYTITYNLNGGTAGANPPAKHTYDTATVLVAPSRTGYTFGGWYTNSDFSGDVVESLGAADYTDNITLYAQWEINKYDVTFNSDGGSAVDKQNVEHGSKATMPANPTKEGYAFSGWYIGESQYNFDTPVTEELTLTAKWTQIQEATPKFTVTFDSEGGSPVDSTEVFEGAVVAEPVAPTREGYTFVGWLNGTTPYNFNAPVTADLPLTAKWDVNTYTVTWDVDGTTTTAEYTYGAAIALPTAPTKDGYTFTGWSGYTNGMTMPAENVTFTAQWQQIYYGGGSSSSSTSTSTSKNPDGSTTTTTTNKSTGVTTETTKLSDGTTGTVTTDKNGNVTEVKASVSAKAVTEAAKTGEAVTLPVEVPAAKTTEDVPAVQVTVPKSAGSVKVEVPVEKVTPGTVAVIVKADGTEEIVKTSALTEDGVVLKLDGSATVKVIDNAKDFSDTDGHWAEDAITFVTAREMFNGTTTTAFAPDDTMTRAMLMTVLARFDGVDTTGGSTWYEKGMEWAKQSGVSDGSDPEGSITREQLATMLWRYSGSPVVEGGLDRFHDADQVSGFAADAMAWAVEIGLIDGIGNDMLAPQSNASRAQLAAILMRYCQALAK